MEHSSYKQKSEVVRHRSRLGGRIFAATALCMICTMLAFSLQLIGTEAGFVYAADDSNGNGVAATKLEIKIGYAGQEPELLKTYTPDELRAIGTRDSLYTMITGVNMPCIQAARGVNLKELFLHAGVDVGSISRVHFTCSDAHETEELTVGFLFGQNMYYYPNLIQSWDYENSSAGIGAEDEKVAVQPMLALEEVLEKTSVNYEYPDAWSDLYGKMKTENRFRLCFGMTNMTKPSSYNSAKWVHSIEISLAGKPPEEKPEEDENDDKDKTIGSEKGDKPDNSKIGDKKKKGNKSKSDDKKNTKDNNGEDGASNTDGTLSSSPSAIVPGSVISGSALSLLDVDGSGEATRRDGYQPWRISEIAEDAVVYVPPEEDGRYAGMAAGTMGGLVVLGGVLQLLVIKKIGIFALLE